MSGKVVDLLLLAAGGALLVLIVALGPPLAGLRAVLGLAFVLFCPGYSLVAALFPRRGEPQPVERMALGFGLSLAVVPLIGLALNYSPWGVRVWPLIGSLGAFVAACAAVAAFRRLRLPAGEAFQLSVPAALAPPRRLSLLSAAAAATLTAALLALGVAAYFAGAAPGRAEKFTEFYVLAAGGRAAAYPLSLQLGEEARLRLVVTNREGEAAAYRIESRLEANAASAPLTIGLDDGRSAELPVSIQPSTAGTGQRLELLLFKDNDATPYRSLHLRLDVAAPPAPPAVAEAAVASAPELETDAAQAAPPAPAIAPALLVTPEGLLHVVQPSEALSAIASQYGISLPALISLNGLAADAGVPPGERLVVPGVSYTVVAGDTLWGIANQYSVSLAALIAANRPADPGLIVVGQVLAIPLETPQ